MKKLILMMACLSMSFYSFGSCISAFNSAYDTALDEYGANLKRCDSALSKVRCRNEANLAFNHAVNTAGDAFYNCGIQ
jgi:hypothetical protein